MNTTKGCTFVHQDVGGAAPPGPGVVQHAILFGAKEAKKTDTTMWHTVKEEAVTKYWTKHIAAEDNTSEDSTTVTSKGGGAQIWRFRPLITAPWFLKDQMRGSNATQGCMLYQLGLWMDVVTRWVFRRVEPTQFVVTLVNF